MEPTQEEGGNDEKEFDLICITYNQYNNSILISLYKTKLKVFTLFDWKEELRLIVEIYF